MPPVVLCDSGPLMVLGKLNRLDLLADLYGQVQIPHAVYDEVVLKGVARGESDAFTVRLFWQRQGWPVADVSPTTLAAYEPSVVLDPGESQVLALAQTLADPLVLLDDQVARAEARRLNLRSRGTVGVLVQAHREGLLSLAQTELLVNEIAARPDVWISSKLCDQVLLALRKRGE